MRIKKFKNIIGIIALGVLLLTPTSAFAQEVYKNTEIPMVKPRESWLTEGFEHDWTPGEEKEDEDKDSPPPYNDIKRIVLHHTGEHVDSKLQKYGEKKVLREMFKFHKSKWGDIGYHFIISPDGTIYEGRYGGNGVRGAHVFYDKKCENHNPHSIGIAVLGNYTDREPPEAVYKSLNRLVGWLAATNDLDPSSLSQETDVWNYEIKNEWKDGNKSISYHCDLTEGGFGRTFEGPVVVGHNDIEPSTLCPGKIDLQRVREKSATFVNDFQSYLYKEDEDYWLLREGHRKKANKKMGKKAVKLNQAQLNYFPRPEKPDIGAGELIRAQGEDRIYLIQKEEDRLVKKPILSEKLLKKKDFQKKPVEELAPPELAYFPNSTPLLFPNGTLLTSKESSDVYLVKNGERHFITSFRLFQKLEANPDSVLEVEKKIIELHPKGNPILFNSGTLVKSKEAPTVYKVKGETLRPIPNLEIFNQHQFSWDDLVTISSDKLTLYREGPPVLYPDGNLLRDRETNKVYYIQKGHKNWVSKFGMLEKLNGGWSRVKHLAHSFLDNYPDGITIANQADLVEVENLKPASLGTSSKKQNQTSKGEEGEEKSQGESSDFQKQENSSQKEEQGTTFPNQEPWVKIKIDDLKESEQLKLTSKGSYNVYVDGKFQRRKSADTTFTLNLAHLNGQKLKLKSKAEAGIFRVLSYENRPDWNLELNDNEFRGQIVVEKREEDKPGFYLINKIKLEDYLKGVAEANPNTDPPFEFLKVRMIAERSYALHYLTAGDYDKHPLKPYDLNNTPADQKYLGHGFEKRAPRVAKAVKATRGKVITYEGMIAIAPYSSDSGGTTVSACKKWGRGDSKYCQDQFDYLDGGIKDPPSTKHNSKGHGVGLSSAGARELIETQDKNDREVLQYYYPGIELRALY